MAEFLSRNRFKNHLFFLLVLLALLSFVTCGGGGTSSVDTSSLPSDTLVLDPASGDFGSVTQGYSATTVVTLSNSGTTAIDVLSMTISDPANFSLDAGGGPNPLGTVTPTIPAGKSRTMAILFHPSSVGTFAADLDIEFGEQEIDAGTLAKDSGKGIRVGWKRIRIYGKGVSNPVPKISIAPPSYNFGDVVTGSASTPATVTVSNTGSADLHVSNIALSDTTNFTLDVNGGPAPCGSTSPTVPPGQNCTVFAQFGPFSAGTFSTALRVESDDPDTSSLGVSLTGTGTVLPPADSTHTLGWTPPTHYTDGTSVTDLAGYILFYGQSLGNYDHSVDVGNETTYSITLPTGTWYFSTKVYTAAGTMSGFSNELKVTF